MEALAHQVPVAASLPDPTLNVTTQPEPVQTAAGQQELIVAAKQKLYWFGKLDTRAGMAEARTKGARARLAAVELATIAKVKQAYYELYFIQQTINVTEADAQLLAEIRTVALTRYQSAQTSQQDALRADLEISNTENQLIQLRQQRASGQARLARLLHIAPQTPVASLDTLAPEEAQAVSSTLQYDAVRDETLAEVIRPVRQGTQSGRDAATLP